jgi:hypothetical protein
MFSIDFEFKKVVYLLNFVMKCNLTRRSIAFLKLNYFWAGKVIFSVEIANFRNGSCSVLDNFGFGVGRS